MKSWISRLTILLLMGVIVSQSITFDSVSSWSKYAGHGYFEDGGYLIGSPNIIFEYPMGDPIGLTGTNITVVITNINGSSWSLLLKISDETALAVWRNETGSGKFTKVIEHTSQAQSIMIQAINGTVQFSLLEISLAEGVLNPYLDWIDKFFYGTTQSIPFALEMGAIGMLAVVGILLAIPNRKSRRR